MADAPVLETGGKPCGFDSHHLHSPRMANTFECGLSNLNTPKIQTFVKKVSPSRGKFAISAIVENVFHNTVFC